MSEMAIKWKTKATDSLHRHFEERKKASSELFGPLPSMGILTLRSDAPPTKRERNSALKARYPQNDNEALKKMVCGVLYRKQALSLAFTKQSVLLMFLFFIVPG